MTTSLPHVTKTQAIALKELGFDWPVNSSYFGENNFHSDWNHSFDRKGHADQLEVSAPTIALSLMWFRNVHGLCFGVYPQGEETRYEFWMHYTDTKNIDRDSSDLKRYATYEEAESALLDHLIEHLKEKRK